MTVQSLFQTVNLLSLKSTRLGIFIALYEFILMQTPLKKNAAVFVGQSSNVFRAKSK